jgi:pimeloyl-ACP methyl ester carboxylesterase
MAYVEVGSESGHPVELSFEDHGTGRPVVLIHGWPLSGRAWESQLAPLVAAGHRVITYDRRGFGKSSQPWGGYDYDTFTADLHALLEALDVRDAALVGFSMGGGEVARYVARHGPSRVSRAVFAGAVPPYLYKSPDNPEGGLDDGTLAGFEEAVKKDRPAFLEEFCRNFFSANGALKVSDAVVRYAWNIGAGASAKGTLDCIAAFGRTDFRKDLQAVRLPTLVLHGDADAIVPFEVSGKRTAASVPGARTVVVKDGPHGFNVSHAEAFNRALLEFLRG